MKKPLLALTILAFTASFAATTSHASTKDTPFPALGDPSAATLPPYKEQKLGQDFMNMVRAQLPLMDDSIVTAYINDLGERLVSVAHTWHRQFQFFMIRDPEINAFAGPGGYVCVNSGLILHSHAEAELAAVLSHEIAHVAQRHIARAIAQEKNNMLPMLAGLVAAAALGAAGSGEAAAGALGAGMATSAEKSVNFTRLEEEEADRIGMTILYNANFDPMSMADFFGKMRSAQMDYEDKPDPAIYYTHPRTPIRIAHAIEQAKQFTPRHYTQNSTDYGWVQARLWVLTDRDAEKKVLDAGARHRIRPEAMHYGLAFLELNHNHPEAAQRHLQPLLKKYPNSAILGLLHSQILLKLPTKNSHQQGVRLAQDLFELYPDYLPCLENWIAVLKKQKREPEAIALLQRQLLNAPGEKKTPLYHWLATLVAAQKQFAQANAYEGQIAILTGDRQRAYHILSQVSADPHVSPALQAQTQLQLQQLRAEMKENHEAFKAQRCFPHLPRPS